MTRHRFVSCRWFVVVLCSGDADSGSMGLKAVSACRKWRTATQGQSLDSACAVRVRQLSALRRADEYDAMHQVRRPVDDLAENVRARHCSPKRSGREAFWGLFSHLSQRLFSK